MKLHEKDQRFGEMGYDEQVGDISVVIPVISPLPFPLPEGCEKTLPLSQREVSPYIHNMWAFQALDVHGVHKFM